MDMKEGRKSLGKFLKKFIGWETLYSKAPPLNIYMLRRYDQIARSHSWLVSGCGQLLNESKIFLSVSHGKLGQSANRKSVCRSTDQYQPIERLNKGMEKINQTSDHK